MENKIFDLYQELAKISCIFALVGMLTVLGCATNSTGNAYSEPATPSPGVSNQSNDATIPQSPVNLDELVKVFIETFPDVPNDVKRKVARLSPEQKLEFFTKLAQNPNAPGEFLTVLARHPDKNIQLLVAKNPNTPSHKNDNKYKRQTILFDDFVDNKNGWWVLEEADRKFFLQDGTYNIRVAPGNNWYCSIKDIAIDHNQNFEVEVKMKLQSDSNDHCHFSFGDDGYWSRRHAYGYNKIGAYWFPDDNFSGWQKNRVAASIFINKNGFNTFTLQKIDGKLFFYINGQNIRTDTFTRLKGTHFGLYASPGSTLTVDYVKASYLVASESLKNDEYKRQAILAEDFVDNKNGWWVLEEADRKFFLEDGNYKIRVAPGNNWYCSIKDIAIDHTQNFEVEVKMKLETIGGNHCHFSFGDKGYWARRHAYGYNILGTYWYPDDTFSGWQKNRVTKSDSINRSGFNTFNLRKINDKLTFYINGENIRTDTFTQLKGTHFGLYAGPGSTLIVDYVRVSYLVK